VVGFAEKKLCWTSNQWYYNVHIEIFWQLSPAVNDWESLLCFFLSCKANARVKLAKTGHSPHPYTLVVICVVRLLFVLFYVLFVCKFVLPPGDNPTAVNKYIIPYHINKWKYVRVKPAIAINTICWKQMQYNVSAVEGVSFIMSLSTIDFTDCPGGCSIYMRLKCRVPRHDKMNTRYYALNSDTEKPQRRDRKKYTVWLWIF
jgi:hypothetical protein